MRNWVIGIPVGEPAGIGPEVVRKAIASHRLPASCAYRVIGSDRGFSPGEPSPSSARAAQEWLEEAVRLWKEGAIHAIVTGPVHKAGLRAAGFPYPGQTEFFADRTGCPAQKVVMGFWHPKLSLTLLSTHCSLREAIASIRPEKIVLSAELLADLLNRLGCPSPRIAIAALNPHAGESGLFGSEERELFEPALTELRKRGRNAVGPLPPDSVFRQAIHGEFAGVVAAYHDQGLIPFKLVAFSTGVNVTLGLPLIRTSPDHGTAFHLAGKDAADPRSMIAAIRLAVRLVEAEHGTKRA
ncbi:4-hydroxythreonine-4-phosphate dehydrogenase [Methylacidimicrobium cyclopophantes]|uniref:4-hydroxythreonine-4-phosphate dehydrogenase n=1 Tax=Methylacidimicrobium cyclopophantes TaxID=1041766 RepID=A0A5E6MFV8_9BACT|nr:4-hydroxythreonine-4-phosphate dehydrogenase PdxA [Methylacidimicrobium cyclopophantes]VVM07240.1 4-hydroxythreonine-4-phosphate dehydrogenase [Methylacidimicrobium cyclopophantes]